MERTCVRAVIGTLQMYCNADDIDNYKNENWLQFLFIVKADVLKQQISKFYPQTQRTEASDHIYFSHKCKSYLLCLKFADKILIFAVLERQLLQ